MTDKYDYSEIDRLLLKAIDNGVGQFNTLHLYVASELSDEAVQELNNVSTGGTYRAVDRRLQVLRKKGEIIFLRSGGGWNRLVQVDIG